MKIALDHTSEIGVRAGRLLLGERDLELLGVVRREEKERDSRVRRIDDLSGFDAVITDDPDSAILDEAVASSIPCVLWADSFAQSTDGDVGSILVGANLVTGIGRSLAARESALAGPDAKILLAWTEPGKPLRRGEAITFPEPVGARWGDARRMTNGRIEVAAPVPDEWAGIVVRSTTGSETRTLGIADLATHLESIALAAAAVVVASGSPSPGAHSPDESADSYLDAAMRLGLDIASLETSS